MDITIRAAEAADLPEVLAMSDALIDEGCCNGMVRDSIEYLQKYHIQLAFAEGEIIGYAYGEAAESSRQIGDCRKGDQFYDLEMIYVKPEYRSSGAGHALFAAQQAYARSLGLATLRLTAVSKDWEKLLRFYTSQGMDFYWATLSMTL